MLGNRPWPLHSVGRLSGLLYHVPRLVRRTASPRPLLYDSVPPVSHAARPFSSTIRSGANMLTILVISVIVGALIRGKSLPKSRLYAIWLVFGVYLYLSMWIGTALGNAPAPLWLSRCKLQCMERLHAHSDDLCSVKSSHRRSESHQDGRDSHYSNLPLLHR